MHRSVDFLRVSGSTDEVIPNESSSEARGGRHPLREPVDRKCADQRRRYRNPGGHRAFDPYATRARRRARRERSGRARVGGSLRYDDLHPGNWRSELVDAEPPQGPDRTRAGVEPDRRNRLQPAGPGRGEDVRRGSLLSPQHHPHRHRPPGDVDSSGGDYGCTRIVTALVTVPRAFEADTVYVVVTLGLTVIHPANG